MIKLQIPAVFFLALILCSCEKQDPDPAYRPEVGEYTSLNVYENVTVRLQNGSEDIRVNGGGDLSSVEFRVNDGLLTIELPDPSKAWNVVVNVYHNDLEYINVSNNCALFMTSDFTSSSSSLKIYGRGSSIISSAYSVTVPSLYINVYSYASLKFKEVNSDVLGVSLSGESQCTLEGYSGKHFLDIRDESLFNLDVINEDWQFSEPLEADSVWVLANSGPNKSWIQANKYLWVEANDGLIYYKGNPDTIEQDLIGDAQLIQKNE